MNLDSAPLRRVNKSVLVALLALAALRPLMAEDISKSGWRLWPDQKAAWKGDEIFLPNDVRVGARPVHPLTGGMLGNALCPRPSDPTGD